MTKFSFEVPHAHLEDFTDLQDFHFALSLHCKYKKYSNYFLRQATQGTSQVWLDNSFNETGLADEPTKLIKIGDKIGAHKIIVPDNPTWSTNKVARIFKKSTKMIPASKAIVVVNSPEMLEEMQRQGALCWALSYHVRLPHYQSGGSWQDFEWAKDCHFLGLCSVEEIIKLNPPTCDTSMPIKLALQGIRLRTWHEQGSPRVHRPPGMDKLSYYDTIMTKSEILLARENILTLKLAAKD